MKKNEIKFDRTFKKVEELALFNQETHNIVDLALDSREFMMLCSYIDDRDGILKIYSMGGDLSIGKVCESMVTFLLAMAKDNFWLSLKIVFHLVIRFFSTFLFGRAKNS